MKIVSLVLHFLSHMQKQRRDGVTDKKFLPNIWGERLLQTSPEKRTTQLYVSTYFMSPAKAWNKETIWWG